MREDGRERDGIADTTARSWGVHIRRNRLRAGLTQAELGARVGISQSMVSRMELGRGAGLPLASWVTLAEAVGLHQEAIATMTVTATGSFGVAALVGLASTGGWHRLGSAPELTLDRAPRLVRRFRRPAMTPGERAVICVVDVLTDVDALVADVMQALAQTKLDAPVGWSVSGLLVVRRTAANRRRLTECRGVVDRTFPDSGSRWDAALRSMDVSMPARPGLLWLDAQATRLIPTGLRLRKA